jgi:CheY-like chemotaxis protein
MRRGPGRHVKAISASLSQRESRLRWDGTSEDGRGRGERALRILAVVDDQALRELLVKVFRRAGFAVAGAAGSSEALPMLARGPFDLLLSDIRRSPGAGLTLAARAKAAAPQTKILLITRYGEPGEERRARAAGAHGCLNQPFTLGEVLAAVRALAGDRRGGEGQVAARDGDAP